MFSSRTNKEFRPETPRDRTSSEITARAVIEDHRQQQIIAPSSVSRRQLASLSRNHKTSSTRRIALALVTLSWSSLNAPLRSILNGFYYLAAIVSLLLLIAYFHQAKAQQAGHRMVQEIEFLQSGASTTKLEAPVRARSRQANSRASTNRAGIKTAIRLPQTTVNSATRATPAGSSSKRPALPELTFRQANDYSENNRGARMASNESQPLLPSSSQWTPIVHNTPRRPMQPVPPPSSSVVHLPPSASILPVVAPSLGHETRHRPTHWSGHESNHHPRHLLQGGRPEGPYRAMSEGRRTWRRPRLNQHGFRQSKMYKRVLICDKTLVSLDYLRDFGAEPRPFPMAHYTFDDSSPSNFIDDNSIEINLNGPGDLLHRRAYTLTASASTTNGSIQSSTTAPSSTTTSTTTTATATAAPTTTTTTTTTSPEDISTADSTAERRSGYQYNMLPDEDALVKCDMWDLEKGLKNRKPPPDILDLAVKADFDTVRDAINRCRQLTEKTLPPDDEYRDGLEIMSTEDLVSLFSMKRGLLPGTKWCGLGDQASTYNDLGPKHRIDICCRAHDHCPIRLKPFRNDYGVLNIALYTKSHCDCDADFYRCLREAHSKTADMLGNLYFNVMKLQCIREERLKVCRELRPIALGFERCVRYEENPMRRVFKFTTPPVAY